MEEGVVVVVENIRVGVLRGLVIKEQWDGVGGKRSMYLIGPTEFLYVYWFGKRTNFGEEER